MKKHIAVAAALSVIGTAFWGDLSRPLLPKPASEEIRMPSIPAAFKMPTLESASEAVLAWNTFQEYLLAAKNHDLEKVRSLSHQLSPACQDPAQEAECLRLMDSVYFFASGLKQSEFRHVESDAKQIILYTDGPVVKLLYFTKDAAGSLKLLGLRFCNDTEAPIGQSCADINASTKDGDLDGWWDSTESLFR